MRSPSPTAAAAQGTRTLAFKYSSSGSMAGCLEGSVFYLPAHAPPSARVRLGDPFPAATTDRVVVDIVTRAGCPYEYVVVGRMKKCADQSLVVYRCTLGALPAECIQVVFEENSKLAASPRFCSAALVACGGDDDGGDRLRISTGLGNMCITVFEARIRRDGRAQSTWLGRVAPPGVTIVALALFVDDGESLLTHGGEGSPVLTRWSFAAMMARGIPFTSRAADAKRAPAFAPDEVASPEERALADEYLERYACKLNFTPRVLAKKEKHWQDVFPAALISEPGEYSGDVNADNLPHGWGSITDDKGVVYTGRWERGRREGYGETTYANRVYRGKWADDRRAGFGVETFQGAHRLGECDLNDGDVVEGFYRNGRLDGLSLWTVARVRYVVVSRAGSVIQRVPEVVWAQQMPSLCWVCLHGDGDKPRLFCKSCTYVVHPSCASNAFVSGGALPTHMHAVLASAAKCPFARCGGCRVVPVTTSGRAATQLPVTPPRRAEEEEDDAAVAVRDAHELFGRLAQRTVDEEEARFKPLGMSLVNVFRDDRQEMEADRTLVVLRARSDARKEEYLGNVRLAEALSRDVDALENLESLSKFDLPVLLALQAKVHAAIQDVLCEVAGPQV